ncbi:hypothetical protein FQN55_009629 [Onygenales sp. PD_40]|nr:hypothetical protein FQN55_009629 [Onygenales sp. PD_40]KAK2792733.1 hypothetical protein FQN52_002795 [Onygenales sp. PD_12]
MGDRRSNSYDGEAQEASVVIHGKEIDSKAAQQLSSSGRAAQDSRIENKANISLNKAFEAAAKIPREETGKEGDRVEQKQS